MARVSIAAAEADEVEVDLWGTLFHTVPVTRTRQRAIRDLDEQFKALQTADPAPEDAEDQAVKLMSQMLDHWLAPEPGKRKKPSDLICQKWEADELAFGQLNRLLEDLSEAAGSRPI